MSLISMLNKLPIDKLKEVKSQMEHIYSSFGSEKETKFTVDSKDISNYMSALELYKVEGKRKNLELNYDLSTSTLTIKCEPNELFYFGFYYACVLNESQTSK